jgi:CubicO group peptidase (beta-lactamase class C family)
LKIGDVIATGELALKVKRKPDIDLSKVKLCNPKPYIGLAVSTDHYDHDKIKALKGNIDEAVFKNITSLVVIKNGKLLIEEYFNGANRNTLHDVRSVGKSFASTIAGIAKGEGHLKNEEQPISLFYDLNKFANHSPQKEQVTIKDLLTMSSGFDGNDDDMDSPGNEEYMYPTDDWVRFALNLPLNTAKYKNEWHYFTAGVVVLGDILNKSVPGGLEHYADKKLFNPLSITRYKWQYTPQNVPSTAGGIQMNTLDFAKYGQLYKNQGKWHDQQIIPADWIQKTFTRHKAIPGRTDEYYGYLFWNKTFAVSGKPYEAFYCSGNGGNYILIFKDQPLVIVITATAYNAPYAHPQVKKMLEQYILPALEAK